MTGDIDKAYSAFNALRDDRDSRYSEREAFKMVLGPIIAEQSALDQAMTAGLHQLRTEHQALTGAPDSRAVVACDPARGLGAAVDAVAAAWAARTEFGKGEPNWMRLLATCYFAWTGGDDLDGPMAAAKRALFGADSPARRPAATPMREIWCREDTPRDEMTHTLSRDIAERWRIAGYKVTSNMPAPAVPTAAELVVLGTWYEGYCARQAGQHINPYNAFSQRVDFASWLAGYQAANADLAAEAA